MYYAIFSGYYCTSGSEIPTPAPCWAGHYCPNGTASPDPCPPGTYHDTEGMEAVEDCLPCSPGKI